MAARVYRIVFAPRAERDFRALAPDVQHRLKPRIAAWRGFPGLEG